VPDVPLHPSIQRVLDAAARKGVTLEVTIFDESTHPAAEAAAAVGAELGQIVKSLVFVAPADPDGLDAILCLVSGVNRVDLSRLAAVTGEKDVRRATAREANELTGYTIGGIPPIGHPRPIRVIMDPDLGRYPVVWAAAGTATAVFPVPPGTLARMHRRSALEIGKREVALAVTAVRRAEEREEGRVLGERHELPVAPRPALRREVEREDPDLSDEWVGHVLLLRC
jgi:prolyl-tRNA editing enzyme YbaK/EbsC (Cys-tRNA(Pro) deacylase)